LCGSAVGSGVSEMTYYSCVVWDVKPYTLAQSLVGSGFQTDALRALFL